MPKFTTEKVTFPVSTVIVTVNAHPFKPDWGIIKMYKQN